MSRIGWRQWTMAGACAAVLALGVAPASARQEQEDQPAQPEPGDDGTVITPETSGLPAERVEELRAIRERALRAQQEQDGQDEGEAPAGADLPPAQPGADEIVFRDFTSPVDLSALVEYVAETLEINIAKAEGLTGSVVFNAPVTVRREELLNLLDALLEMQNYTIVRDRIGFYHVIPIADVTPTLVGERATMRVIPTPNVKPSSLRELVTTQFGDTGRISYVDDLGVIVMTDSPRRIDAVEELVGAILAEQARVQFIRFELRHVAAPVARERAVALVTSASAGGAGSIQEMIRRAQGGEGAAGLAVSLSNLADRLVVDPQGNALIFRGSEAEAPVVRAVVEQIDAPKRLVTKEPYETGSGTAAIANLAQSLGLGEVLQFDSAAGTQGTESARLLEQLQRQQQEQGLTGTTTVLGGGSVIVVDEYRGQIFYYGTEEQHAQLADLVNKFGVRDERVVIREYKLHNAKALTVANLLMGLITNSTPAAEGSELLPEGGFFSGTSGLGLNQGTQPRRFVRQGTEGAEGEIGLEPSEDIFVLGDEANNQVLVKAPIKQQADFERLIMKLDQRRPQVYIEAKIVAISASDSLRLAFETQLINAQGSGGVLNTNFGLGSFATGSSFTDPKSVATGLGGLTAAVIKSEYVPIVINALANEADGRILATPQLLVNDNEEASVVSSEQQPTAVTSTGQTTDQTGFGGYEEARTSLTVTPQISEGGYLRMDYVVELESFFGQATPNLPPPKLSRTVDSSVTIPSDSTMIVGGITLDTRNKAVVKVPLLGEIPIVKHLFRDTSKSNSKTVLYIFLTPRILRDPGFADLRLLSRGPQGAAGIGGDIPPMKPVVIDILGSPMHAEDWELEGKDELDSAAPAGGAGEIRRERESGPDVER